MIYTFPIPSALGTYQIKFDELSSLMISFSSLVFMMVLIHMVKFKEDYGTKYVGMLNILFIACILAMCADSVILLLMSWELITLTTFLMTCGADEAARWRFFTITHFGGLIIMTVFAAMWYISGTGILSDMDPVSSLVGTGLSAGMILLLFIGFGTKLGSIPFHVWMPDLYNSAPIHTIALLSTVCSNVAIVLLMKASFLWIGIPDNIILPLALLVIASGSAIWGAMESLVQTEPRRILAYSSMENIAMVIICMATGTLFLQMGFDNSYVIMILAAAVLHTINHSFFKSLMLLNVGTVERCTGEHAIEKMGGLAKVLPVLSVFALVGTLSMAAIPPLNGFVSEWLMIKTVISAGTGTSIMNIALPLIVTVLGICGMMAAVSYARLYGFMFLGRPRSEAVAKPKKIDRMTMIPLFILSIVCIGLGIFSMPVINSIINSMCSTFGFEYKIQNIISDSLNPIVISVILVVVIVTLYAIFKIFKKKTDSATTWDCGTELKDNMQYSSIGFTQPLVHVFHPLYGDNTEITKNISNDTGTYSVKFIEPFMKYILSPIGKGVLWIANKIGKIQTGNIQSYLAYLLITLIVVLLGARFL